MTSHLTWSVQLVLSSLLPLPLSRKSQKPLGLWCKHLISTLKAPHAYSLFFYLNDQPKFYYRFSQLLVPSVYNNHLLVISGALLLMGERGAQRASIYTFWEAVQCSEESRSSGVRQSGLSLSPSSCFVTWTMGLFPQ